MYNRSILLIVVLLIVIVVLTNTELFSRESYKPKYVQHKCDYAVRKDPYSYPTQHSFTTAMYNLRKLYKCKD
jgi:hypothetical protein